MPFDGSGGEDRNAYCRRCGTILNAEEFHFYEDGCEDCERIELAEYMAERRTPPSF